MNNQRQSINEYENKISSNSQNLNTLANATSRSSRLQSRTPENSKSLKEAINKQNIYKNSSSKVNSSNRLLNSYSIGKGMRPSSNSVNNAGLGNRLKSIIGINKSRLFQNNLFRNTQDDSAVPDENTGDSVDDTLTDETSKQDKKSLATFGTFQIKLKHIKLALIIGAPILGALIIVCLLMSSSLVKLDLLGIGTADVSTELEESEIEESFEEHEEDTDLEIDDDSNSSVSFYTKRKESNLKFIARRKKRNEARLDELSDYYPAIEKYKDQYDEKMLYNFYYKIHLITKTYKSRYNVNVDVPLLMATLMMQAKDKDDMNIVFDSNLSSEDNFYEQKSTNEEQNLERFNYDYDWSNYSPSKSNSEHDIEVLVQHMFSSQAKETCVNSEGDVTQENILRDEEKEKETLTCEEGEEYKKEFLGMEKDDEKYKEFLRTFLEEKYILNDDEFQDGVYLSGVTFMDSSFGEIMYYNQCDDPNAKYGNIGSMCAYGCGPTSLSIAISSILKQEHNPVEITNYVCSIGGCTTSGTAWSAIAQTPLHYGLKVNNTGDTKQVIDALSKGDSLVIALMCVGHFTSSGHFITLTGTTSDGQVSVADPASRDRSTNWDFNIVAEETCRSTSTPYWIISK